MSSTTADNNEERLNSKRIRMTIACERCRSKKVKCDFSHPTCTRCQNAKASCSYNGNSTQFNLFNLMKLNETVDMLQNKIQSLESKEPEQKINGVIPSSNTQWSLSLTPKGLSIDTNVISLPHLYDTLLSGISHFDLDEPRGSAPTESTTVLRKTPLWKSHMKTHPLYSLWEPEQPKESTTNISPVEFTADLFPEETLLYMVSIFEACFLCLPSCNPTYSIAERYKTGVLDPLLANCVFAWTSRHTAIYHNLFPGKDPNQVGHHFFLKAKELIKDRFMTTSEDTMFSLLIMYIYTIGIPTQDKASVESEAYLYLGLAIRMCLDVKMNQESKSDDPYERERNRRFFWVIYFLETLSAIHSDKSLTLPPKNMITVEFPTLMEHEKSGETRYRVEFIIQRFKITRIYRDIINQTTEEKPLLSQISAIDKELQRWYADLPVYFIYETGDVQKRNWESTSFKEQACIKLNFEYNFQLCQLYSMFLTKEDEKSHIEVLSHRVCLNAAQNTVELLECWVQLNQPWCHFSFENLMATTMIYGHVIATGEQEEQQLAKRDMQKIAAILRASPIKGHKYVSLILDKINTSLNTTTTQQQQQVPTSLKNTDTTNNQQFSDFVYWPTLLDFGTALNSPNILQQQQTQSYFFDPQWTSILDNNQTLVVYPPAQYNRPSYY